MYVAGKPFLWTTGRCARCGKLRPLTELNVEAQIHHGASKLECLDRKRCERDRRKAKR